MVALKNIKKQKQKKTLLKNQISVLFVQGTNSTCILTLLKSFCNIFRILIPIHVQRTLFLQLLKVDKTLYL